MDLMDDGVTGSDGVTAVAGSKRNTDRVGRLQVIQVSAAEVWCVCTLGTG